MKKISLICICLLLCCLIISGCSKKKVSSSTNLIDAVSISELYGSEFIYNGIAQITENGKTYNVRYNSVIKVGIDASSLAGRIVIDEENKTISVTIPEITIMDVIVDTASLEYLPEKPHLEIKKILAECERDAINGANSETLFIHNNGIDTENSNTMLYDLAEENICSAIRGLIEPLIEGTDYSLDFYRDVTTHTTEVIR